MGPVERLAKAIDAVSAPERPHPDAALGEHFAPLAYGSLRKTLAGDLHKWVTFRSAWVVHFSPDLDRRWLVATINSCVYGALPAAGWPGSRGSLPGAPTQ